MKDKNFFSDSKDLTVLRKQNKYLIEENSRLQKDIEATTDDYNLLGDRLTWLNSQVVNMLKKHPEYLTYFFKDHCPKCGQEKTLFYDPSVNNIVCCKKSGGCDTRYDFENGIEYSLNKQKTAIIRGEHRLKRVGFAPPSLLVI